MHESMLEKYNRYLDSVDSDDMEAGEILDYDDFVAEWCERNYD